MARKRPEKKDAPIFDVGGIAVPDFDPAVIELYLHGEKEDVCFYRDGCVQEFD